MNDTLEYNQFIEINCIFIFILLHLQWTLSVTKRTIHFVWPEKKIDMTFYLQILTCYNSNYWIFNCEYCISNVLIGSLNSGYQLMFQVTLYGIIELMQRSKKRLLFSFTYLMHFLQSFISFPQYVSHLNFNLSQLTSRLNILYLLHLL